MLSANAQYLLEKYLDTTETKNYEIHDVSFNPKGTGFMSEITYLTVVDQDAEEKKDLVLKCAFSQESIRELFPVREFFLNEINFYSKMLPELQGNNKIDFITMPLFYSEENGKEGLVFRNLKSEGYSCVSMNAHFSRDHLELLMKTYGRFHAYSFALKHYNYEKFLDLVKSCEDTPLEAFSRLDNFTSFRFALGKLCNLGLSYLDEGLLMDKFKEFTPDPAEILLNTYTAKNISKYTCIIHGDCWSNNFLFRYTNGDTQHQLKDTCVIDFQWVALGSPICDLSYCLYASAPATELENYHHYLKEYHLSLTTTLREFECDSQEVFPFAELLEDWKKFSKYGMLMSFFGTRNKLMPSEEILELPDLVDQTKEKPFFPNGFDEDRFRSRMRDIILHNMNNSDTMTTGL